MSTTTNLRGWLPGPAFRWVIVWATGTLLALLGGGHAPAALEDEVRVYETQDVVQPPPVGATLFVGSSSIRGWTNLAASFPDRDVLNRGFGGSQMSDLLHYFDRLVLPYRPPIMVVYEGDNDLAGSKTASQVFDDYRQFAAQVEQHLPGTAVVFLAVKPSPSRAAFMPKMEAFNAMLEDFCEGKPHVRFVDIYTPMLDAQGQPRPELFQSDQLHMVAAGYSLWTSLIAPVLVELEPLLEPGALGFVEQPSDVTVEAGQPATFGVVVTGGLPISVQWFRGGEAILGATGLSLRIPEVTSEMQGQRFSVRVRKAGSEIMSRDAWLQVLPDTTPPTVLTVSTTDGVQANLVFSEALDPASATAVENFSIRGGLVPILSAIWREDTRTVELTFIHRVGGSVGVSMMGIRDRAGNTMAAGTAMEFQAPVPQPQAILIDFGAGGSPTLRGEAAGQDPVHRWNNVTSVGLSSSARLDGLVAADGHSTPLSLIMLSRFNGANENGTTEAAPFAANAVRDSLFGNTESFNGMSQVFPSFKLTGLNPSLSYDLTFYASRTGVSDNRETGYTVTGASVGFASLNVANNRTATAEVSGIKPTESGEVVISLAPTPANTNANHFTYLGVLRLRTAEQIHLDAPRRLSDSLMVLDWAGQGWLEWTTDLASPDWNPITPAPVPPWFEDITKSPQRYYRLRPPGSGD